MEFRNKYDSTEDFSTEVGSPIAPVYGLSTDKDGNIELIQTGETNIYEEIQSHADSVDINTIMARYEMGDVTMLSKRNGQYIDISDMPCNFTEMVQKIIIAEKDFENLPEAIRSQYGSVQEYVNDIGSEKWLKLFNPEPTKTEPIKEEPSNE